MSSKTSEGELPEQLFHYTSMQGLLGIIETKKIWATNLAYLNDKTEFVHARDMFISALSSLREEIESKEPQPAVGLYDSYLKKQKNRNPKVLFLERIIKVLEFSEKGYPFYICSFSQEPDQLSQWRGYCQNTYGFSIGFNYSKLKENADRNNFTLIKCIYDKEEQNNIIDKFIEKQIKPELDNFTESNSTELIVKIMMNIIEVLPVLKNKSFEEEQEWRLICPVDGISRNLIKHRQGKTLLIPYYEFELTNESEELPIDSIIIGPTPNQDESKISVSLLVKQQIRKINIALSEIPYREM